jgi:hypothetical protein
MAKDAELERLGAARDQAFQRKQDAYQAQDRAWERRSSARDAMNRAYENKQHAYETQQASWNELQRLRDRYGPKIEQWNRDQEAAYQNMVSAIESSKNAFSSGNHESAKSYSEEGRRYKGIAQNCVQERRALIAELKAAQERHEATKPAFQRAKEAFMPAKEAFDRAKTEHESAQAKFRTAKAEFDKAAEAFKTRLEKVKAENKKRRSDKRSIAEKAGVPREYLDNVWISKDSNGNTNIYFGGIGKPDGPEHGHYVVNPFGRVTYKRNPHGEHGAQNFERDERVEREMARLAMDAWARQQTDKREIQYQDGNFTVKVRSGYSRNRDAMTTDVIIAERSSSSEHYHLVIDDYGNVVFSEWRKNH